MRWRDKIEHSVGDGEKTKMEDSVGDGGKTKMEDSKTRPFGGCRVGSFA